ncbi:MAG: zf-TFIIB domain-containing protein [Planctomycetota bacterium]
MPGRLLSPVDRTTPLRYEEIEPDLKGYTDPNGGVWLPFDDYDRWLTQHRSTSPSPPPPDTDTTPPAVIEDSPAGKLCPEDGAFLIRRRVSAEIEFHVDRCGHCGGVWLDPHEWQTLRAHGLAKSLALVFTDAYQAKLRAELQAQSHRQRLETVLGSADLTRIEQFADWANTHEHRGMLLAHLQRLVESTGPGGSD